MGKRDEFSDAIKKNAAARVSYTCSNPDCRLATTGPHRQRAKAVNVGVAAHIAAAASGGPRYDASLTAGDRGSAGNAIWLCQRCAKLVDSDVDTYTKTLLKDWRKRAEAEAGLRIRSSSIASDIARTTQPRQSRIVAFCGTKGGTGRTTAAMSLTGELMRRGKNVLYVAVQPGFEQAWLIMAELTGAPAPVVWRPRDDKALSELIGVGNGYDHVVVDCPSHPSDILRSVVHIADIIIVPCPPCHMDMIVTERAVRELRDLLRLKPLLRCYVLISKVAKQWKHRSDVARAEICTWGIPVLRTHMTHTDDYSVAPSIGMTVTTFNPAGKAAWEVRALVAELELVSGSRSDEAKPKGVCKRQLSAAERQRYQLFWDICDLRMGRRSMISKATA